MESQQQPGASAERAGDDIQTLEAPLILAAKKGGSQTVQALLGSGGVEVLATTDRNGWNALHWAVVCNQRITVALLLDYVQGEDGEGGIERGTGGRRGLVDSQTGDTGDTSLNLAAKEGLADMVRFLLDHDADIGIVNFSGENALHCAVGRGGKCEVEVAELLLERGADPEEKTRRGDGKTALEILGDTSTATCREGDEEEAGKEKFRQLLLSKPAGPGMEILGRSFLAAAEAGRAREVSRLLKRGVDVNFADASEHSGLMLASRRGRNEVVQLLLEKGAEVDKQDENGQTALWWAAFYGHEQTSRYLLENGAKVDLADEDGFTPLSMAARKKREGVAELLVKAWAQVDYRDEAGRSPFLYAVASGSLRIVKTFLDEGNWGDSEDYEHFNKALEMADDYGHEEIADLLIANGAEDFEDDEEVTENPAVEGATVQLQSVGLKDGENPDQPIGAEVGKDIGPDEPGHREGAVPLDWETEPTGLIHALMTKDLARVRRLMGSGGSGVDAMRCKTETGHTPLMEAAAGGFPELIDTFLNCGVPLEGRNIRGQTALWQAAQNGVPESVGLLLQKGADIEARSTWGTSPLAAAAAWGREAVVKLLVERGARIDSGDYRQQTALTLAATSGHNSIVQFLLQKGADIEHSTRWGMTPLHLATVFGRRSTIQVLLDAGANISATMGEVFNHETALTFAARRDLEAVTELLINCGADLTHRNALGRTCLHTAASLGNSMIVKLLLENGAQVKAKENSGITPLCGAKMRHDLDRNEVIELLSHASEIRRRAGVAKKNNTRRYKYRPISTGESKSYIRLLELRPGKNKEIIKFDLFEVDLDDSPIFEALSYEWGERAGSIPVQCGDGYLLVTPNLKAVLRRLRKEDKPRLVWIDALCINQEDIPERNYQVSLMTKIYRTAHKVNMWLGDSEAITELGFNAIALFNRIYDAKAKLKPNFQHLAGKVELDAPTRDTVIALWDEIVSNGKVVDGLVDLFKRGYFTRAWIFQEIILANQGTMMCGEYECSLAEWKRTLYVMDASDLDFLLSSFPDEVKQSTVREILRSAQETNRAITTINMLAELYHLKTSRTLFDSPGILASLANLQAGDPRDKVYAAVGLLSAKEQEALAPDYSLSTQETYIRAAAHMLTMHEKHPKIWGEWNRPHDKRIPDLPSWVPDWSAPPREDGVATNKVSKMHTILPGQFGIQKTRLRANAYILDRVALAAPASLAEDMYEDVIAPVARYLAGRFNASLLDPYPHSPSRPNGGQVATNLGSTYLTAIWDVLVRRNRTSSSSSDPRVQQAISYLAWRFYTAEEDFDPHLLPSPDDMSEELKEKLNNWTLRSLEEDDFDSEVYEWIDRVRWRNNDVIVTEKGGIGLSGGYKIAEKGLVIAVVGGIDHLCLLREHIDDEDDGEGKVWYEYVERAVLRHVTEEDSCVESLRKEAEGNMQRLEIR
ncbi:ankyrin repeat-containing domain protein [Cladorrhinum samala]|uniref:Ankyrin repeat-containing domain protein n=1 Tax=Cladorrhinum samala TaxID=585594 RepID=A0AAV9HY14_9PEZI|nr:ankyrin repeat-containing domain protein [Cladorrhinum samala]